MPDVESMADVRRMMASVRTVGAVLLAAISVGAAQMYPWLAALALAAVLVAALVSTWYYLFRVGLRHAGLGYALGHLVLSVVLTPLLFLGVVIIPALVRSDLAKWDESEKSPTQPGPV